jgi:hypothetical protein
MGEESTEERRRDIREESKGKGVGSRETGKAGRQDNREAGRQ